MATQQPTTIGGDMYVRGNLNAQSMTLPANSVTDSQVAAGAAIQASKLIQQQRPQYSQAVGSAAAAETRTVYLVYGASGALVDFRAGCVVANIGAATITVDLKKNGTSVLTAPISLSSSQTARQTVVATIATATLAAGDELEVVVAVSASTGTLGQGVFAAVTLTETPS